MKDRHSKRDRSVEFASGEHLAIVSLGMRDAGEILTLQRAAYLSEAAAHSDFALPPLIQSLSDLKSELSTPDVMALGIRDAGRLVASLRLHRSGPVVDLRRLIVAPDRQGQGLGSRLLSHAETVFPDCREIRLFTGEHSTANIRLYTRFGYRECDRTPAGGYDLVHFAKALTQAEKEEGTA